MYSALVLFALANMLYFALHITSGGSFPKPLSKDEELECLKKISEGDQVARNQLIEHNLRLVAHIIKKYYSSYRDQEDLISIGTIGLIKAVGSFDYLKGTKFATYASRCIENEILMHFRNKKKTMHDVSISDPIDTDKDGNSISLIDVMQDDGNILDSIDLSMKSQKLYDFIKLHLDEREQRILTLRYGLYGTIPLTQREVAKKLEISRSYPAVIIGLMKSQYWDSQQTRHRRNQPHHAVFVFILCGTFPHWGSSRNCIRRNFCLSFCRAAS